MSEGLFSPRNLPDERRGGKDLQTAWQLFESYYDDGGKAPKGADLRRVGTNPSMESLFLTSCVL